MKTVWLRKQIKKIKIEATRPSVWDEKALTIAGIIFMTVLLLSGIYFFVSGLYLSGMIG